MQRVQGKKPQKQSCILLYLPKEKFSDPFQFAVQKLDRLIHLFLSRAYQNKTINIKHFLDRNVQNINGRKTNIWQELQQVFCIETCIFGI